MSAAMKSGSDGNYEVEHTVLNPITNQEYILLSKGKSLFEENNNIVELSGTVQDITEQVLARRKIEDSEELKVLYKPWQIFQYNDWALRQDFELITAKRNSQPIPVSKQHSITGTRTRSNRRGQCPLTPVAHRCTFHSYA